MRLFVKGRDLRLGDWVFGSIARNGVIHTFDSPYCLLSVLYEIMGGRTILSTHLGTSVQGGFLNETTYEVFRFDSEE